MAAKHWFSIFVWVMLLLCTFFLWFFNGNWLLGITSHGIPSSAWGRDVKEQMTLELDLPEGKKKRSLQNCYARHIEKVSCSHSPMVWRGRERIFVSQPRIRNLQTVLLFCSVRILLTVSLWGQATLRTVVSHLKHRNLQAPSPSPWYDLIMRNRKTKRERDITEKLSTMLTEH